MSIVIKQKKYFTIILAFLVFMVPEVFAIKLTLSDEGLMSLGEYSTYIHGLKATILETRDVEGPGVEFDIYFPGNKSPNHSIYYIFSKEKLKEVFQGVDIASCNAFELKFTLLSVNGSDSPENEGALVVGALRNRGYRPEVISLSKNHPNTAVSITTLNSDRITEAGFTAHMFTPGGWDSNGVSLTLLIESASSDIIAPLAKQEGNVESQGKMIYVDSSASGAKNGLSWIDAFANLQDGLGLAVRGDEIWVAEGSYKPDRGETKKEGDKEASFVLKKGVGVYGGFPTGGGVWQDRSRANKTILSGDLQGNDVKSSKDPVANITREDNSYRIVSASGTDFDTVLDGFIITGGNAKGPRHVDYNAGGGLYCKSGSLTLSNCLFKANAGIYGGAICNLESNPLIIKCTFLENYAEDSGGAIYSTRGSSIIYNCLFDSNHAKEKGGGIYDEFNSSITVNCTFSGNSAYAGGGMYCNKSKPFVSNCILWDNSSRYGKLEPSQIYAVSATVNYSCIQGLTEHIKGDGNIDRSPKFLNAAEHDFSLRAGSPCIDAGINELLPEEIETDASGGARLKDGDNDGTIRIDMGAWEY